MRASHRFVLSLSLVALVAAVAFGQSQRVSRQDADSLARKIQDIAVRGEIPSKTPVRTPVSENEVNSYLAVYGKRELPVGVVNPRVSILGGDRLSGQATVDLDAVRKNSSGGWFDPASYVTGKVPVTAKGVLTTKNGIARFQLESATAGGIPVPKSLLQQILSYYSKSPDFPNGINLDDPFQMPANIRTIEMPKPAQAVVVQQ